MCLAVPSNVWRRLEGVTIDHASTIEVDHHDRGDDWNGESGFHCFLNLLASQNPQLAISYYHCSSISLHPQAPFHDTNA